jgi:multidrug efflux pump subunit AcrB
VIVGLAACGQTINLTTLGGFTFAIAASSTTPPWYWKNINRHLEMGKLPEIARADGTGEVRCSVLASTISTMVVFLPVRFYRDGLGLPTKEIAGTQLRLPGSRSLPEGICLTNRIVSEMLSLIAS